MNYSSDKRFNVFKYMKKILLEIICNLLMFRYIEFDVEDQPC